MQTRSKIETESSSLPNESEKHRRTMMKKCQKKKTPRLTSVKVKYLVFADDREFEIWKREEHKRLVKEHEAQIKKYEPIIAKRKRLDFKKSEKQYISHGYIFKPTEELLVDYYLRKKCLDEPMDFHPIEEVDVYATHPKSLIENYQDSGEKVWYFFSQSHPNEVEQSTGGVQGHWIFGEKNDVLHFEEGSSSGNSKFKIIEYGLDPAAAANSPLKNGMWFICMLCNGAV